MAKNSIAKSSQYPCKSLALLLLFLLLPVLLILFVLFQGSQDKIEYESDSSVEESPYHNTLELSLNISTLHNKISASEAIWGKFAPFRKQAIAASKSGSAHLLNFLKYFPPSFGCPFLMEPIGDDLGTSGLVCGLELFENEEECVFYSIGISPSRNLFETELLKRTNHCHVLVYGFPNEFLVDPSYLPRVEYQQIGNVSDKTGKTKLSIPVINSLLKANGHGWIDILKIDLDAHGFSIVEGMLKEYEEVLPFGQLQFRFTLWGDHPFDRYITLFEALEELGLRPFHVNVEQIHCDNATSVETLTVEYSFINIRGKHVLLTGAT